MGMTRKIEALLLDLDGTVADTHELIYQCFSEMLEQPGDLLGLVEADLAPPFLTGETPCELP